MTKMAVIVFHRGDVWYPVEYPANYKNWKAEAERNPGTTRIETAQGKILWPIHPSQVRENV